MTSASRGSGTLVGFPPNDMPRVGLAKTSLRDLRMLNRERSAVPASGRATGSAGSDAVISVRLISASDSWP